MTVWGPDFNGRVFAEPDRSSAEPENQAEALDEAGLLLALDIFEIETKINSVSLKAELAKAICAYIGALASLPEAPAVPVGATAALTNLAHEMRFLLRNNPKMDGGLYRKRLDEADAAIALANGDCPCKCDEGGICLAELSGFPQSCQRSALQSFPPVKAAAVDGARAVIEELQFALRSSDLGIRDRADQAARLYLAALASQPAPDAWMHPLGAIWRADNYPAGIDFSKDGWIALYRTRPAPTAAAEVLPYVVEYRRIDTGITWIPMAAFDVEGVAEKYAADCGRGNTHWEYRAIRRAPHTHNKRETRNDAE
jgi:hypothetical protein